MSLKTVSRVLLAALLVFAVGQMMNSTSVTAGLFGTRVLDQTGCCRCCPVCDHVCKFDAEMVDEDIPCFDVESKVICIPRVVFPWQKKSCNSCSSCDGKGCSSCINNGANSPHLRVENGQVHLPQMQVLLERRKDPLCRFTRQLLCQRMRLTRLRRDQPRDDRGTDARLQRHAFQWTGIGQYRSSPADSRSTCSVACNARQLN